MDSYSEIAAEYYDARLHPTSAAFRAASRSIIEAWVPKQSHTRGLFCDVGAGDSVLAEVLTQRGRSLRRLRLVDSSEEMLKYSARWIQAGAVGLIAEAHSVPIRSQTVALLVASLGDPYNDILFWYEAARIVQDDGLVIFTTPSYEWAKQFRCVHREQPDVAEFTLRSGRIVHVPSMINPEREQIALVRRVGFRVHGIYHFFVDGLSGSVPPKLEQALPPSSPIVTGYLLAREAARE